MLALSGSSVTLNQVIAHAELGNLSFTPVAHFAGAAAFTFEVVDQSDRASTAAAATITVDAVADAPEAGRWR